MTTAPGVNGASPPASSAAMTGACDPERQLRRGRVPYYADESVTLWHGDCIEVMRDLPDASVDAICTDPPYGLEFMGKEWDSFDRTGPRSFDDTYKNAPEGVDRDAYGRLGGNPRWSTMGPLAMLRFQSWCTEWALEALRVLKPGGHLLAFGGTRTWHRLACAIEDAGFEVRDSIAWMYGSGFPKSLDVSKAIDKAAGATRTATGVATGARNGNGQNADYGSWGSADLGVYEKRDFPATPEAARWQGWGTALKPAFEPIVVARKPLIGTVAANVLAHGTGALNVDGCRVAHDAESAAWVERWAGDDGHPASQFGSVGSTFGGSPAGRWPANVILDESQAAELDRQSGVTSSGQPTDDRGKGGIWSPSTGKPAGPQHGDTGGASRFFYTAKADATERPRVDGVAHPTVKPLDLMRYLVRLVTPPGGVVLEPFAGSGTTAEACIVEGFSCIAIEREADYLPLILARISKPIEVTLL